MLALASLSGGGTRDDEHLDVQTLLVIDDGTVLVEILGIRVQDQEVEDLKSEPFLQVQNPPLVLVQVLPSGFVETSPKGVPNVERQNS